MASRIWTRLLLVLVLAACSFAGTFVCKSSTHDDLPPPPPRPAIR
jgi:hypothetical protein